MIPLVLGEDREELDGHLVRVGIVDAPELDARLQQASDEVNVAAQAVELGDDQRRPAQAADPHRIGQLRPVRVPLAALLLSELLDEGPSLEPLKDGLLLSIDAEAVDALLRGADPVNRPRISRCVSR